MTSPGFRGYELTRLLGVGPAGEAWSAVETSTGAGCVLRRLRPALARRAGERLMAADLPDAGYVAVRGLVTSGHEVAVVTELAVGGSLRAAGSQPLARFAALAVDLARLHAQATVHGALTPANVLVGHDRLLLDVDITRLLGALESTAHRSPYADEPPGPAGDVRAFALLCLRYAAGAPQEVLRAVAYAPPAERPTMVELAAALAAAVDASSPPVAAAAGLPPGQVGQDGDEEVVGQDGDEEVPVHVARAPASRARPGGGSRRAPAVALLTLVAGAGVGLGVLAGHGRSQPSPAHLSRGGPDWSAVVTDLVARRATAIRRLDPVALTAVYAGAAPQRAADVGTVQRWRAAGAVAVPGYASSVLAVRSVAGAAGRVTVAVTDTLSAYDVVAVGGQVLEHVAPRPARTWTVVMQREGDGWRLWSVEPA